MNKYQVYCREEGSEFVCREVRANSIAVNDGALLFWTSKEGEEGGRWDTLVEALAPGMWRRVRVVVPD